MISNDRKLKEKHDCFEVGPTLNNFGFIYYSDIQL